MATAAYTHGDAWVDALCRYLAGNAEVFASGIAAIPGLELMPLDATYQAINLDGRFFFATSSRVQPHVVLGAAFPWLTIKDASFLDPDTGDVRLRGYGVNTELGATVFPTPQLGIGVGYSYRVMWFDRGTGVSDTLFELRPRFRETANSVVINGTFVF